MATQTTNLHLVKPAYADVADISVLNGNSDIIDGVIGGVAMGTTANTLTGAIAEHEQDITSANEAIAQRVLYYVPVATDMNSTPITNTLYAGRWAGASTSHAPSTNGGGAYFGYASSANYQTQVAIDNFGVAFIRYQNAGTWYPWSAITEGTIMSETAISIPASGSSVTKTIDGLTASHRLIEWNFSSSAENNPPVSLTWSTSAGSFTITNNGGTTSETIRPVFVKPAYKTAT